MDIDAQAMVDVIAGSASDYFGEFMPLFVFVAGILLAFGIMSLLLNYFLPRRRDEREEEVNIFDDNPIW